MRLPDKAVVSGACEKNPQTDVNSAITFPGAVGPPARLRAVERSRGLHIRALYVRIQSCSRSWICSVLFLGNDDAAEAAVVKVP